MSPDIGELGPMLATDVQQAGEEIAHINAPYNYVVIDSNDNIAHFTAGRVPVRKIGDGSVPLPADINADNWDGLIVPENMPGVINPARGWVGNANNRTLPADYPHAYSTFFAHAWRYDRMLQLLDNNEIRTADDHWAMMLDTGNTLAERVTPIIIDSLDGADDVKHLAAYLTDWNFMDDPAAVAPTVFHSLWRHFVARVYSDELGPELSAEMLDNYYYWEERLWSFVSAGESVWFDDVNTDSVETMRDLFILAARDAQAELTDELGADSSQWQWGRLHTVTFFSPVAPGDTAAKWLGGGTFPKEGSGETLNRGKYKFNEPYRSVFIDSMRFLADMSDDDKVWAVLSGGASGRQFDPHLKDQMAVWLTGEPNFWWFSDTAIQEHAVSELTLMP
jgi:penicillin amidase